MKRTSGWSKNEVWRRCPKCKKMRPKIFFDSRRGHLGICFYCKGILKEGELTVTESARIPIDSKKFLKFVKNKS